MRFSPRQPVAVFLRAAIALALTVLPIGHLFADPPTWRSQLAKIRPDQHAVAGTWRVTGDGLRTEASASSRIVVPVRLPDQYDLRVRFTRHTGRHSVALFFSSGTGRATVELDAWSRHLAGVQSIAGQPITSNPTRAANRSLENGRVYVVEVQVRRESVTCRLDGKTFATYQGDGSDLSLHSLWQMPEDVGCNRLSAS